MTLYAALRGKTLYVATWAPGGSGNDHFILISNAALAPATSPAPWAKAGGLALPATSPFLGAESASSYIGWFNVNGATTKTARSTGQQMEGTLDLETAFGTVPADLYLTALAYQTADGGALAAQAPAMINDNGNVDPDELLRIPLEALRDEDANGIFDRLESGKGFVITQSQRSAGTFSLTWNCFPGRSYQVQASADLATWSNVPGGLVIAGSSALDASYAVPLLPAEAKGFFRILLIP
jgi:hypothetical protein